MQQRSWRSELAECTVFMQAAVTKMQNDAVVVPLRRQAPANATGEARAADKQQEPDQAIEKGGPKQANPLMAIDPNLADAAGAAVADTTASGKGQGGASSLENDKEKTVGEDSGRSESANDGGLLGDIPAEDAQQSKVSIPADDSEPGPGPKRTKVKLPYAKSVRDTSCIADLHILTNHR